MHLPIFFNGSLLKCLVVGGGPSVLCKVEALIEAGSSVMVISKQPDFKVVVLASLARVKLEQRDFEEGDYDGYDLIVIGSEEEVSKKEIAAKARDKNIPVNVCGAPDISTFYFPAVLREGDLTAAVSSGGTAPFMAVEFQRRLAGAVKGWARWVTMGGRFRKAVLRSSRTAARRTEYYGKFIAAGPFQLDPEPSEKTTVAEWLQILQHTSNSSKDAGRSAGVRSVESSQEGSVASKEYNGD